MKKFIYVLLNTLISANKVPDIRKKSAGIKMYKYLVGNIRQINNIDFLSEESTVHQFVYTDEALLLVR